MIKLKVAASIFFVALMILVVFMTREASTAPDAVVRGNPINSQLIWEDSTRIDSTETKIMKAVWQDGYAQKAILIEARDDSTAGLISDSACVRISVLQLFPFNGLTGNTIGQFFVALNSRANPDSTTKMGSSVFNLFDSLNILSMDTAAVYKRGQTTGATFGGTGWMPNDTLKTLQTVAKGYGAFAYTALPFDFSPAIAFKLKGCASNHKGGVGSMWKIRVYGLKGNKVNQGN